MISFQLEKDGDEFHAWSPQLPGCHTHGKTEVSAMHNLKDAIMLYLEDIMEESLQKKKFSVYA